MQGEQESADEYAQRLMSHYRQRNSPFDPSSSNSQRTGREEDLPFPENPDPDDDDPFQDDPSVGDNTHPQHLFASDSTDPGFDERSENDLENKLQPNDADQKEERLSTSDDYAPETP